MRSLALLLSLIPAACTYDSSLGRTTPPLSPGHFAVRWAQAVGDSATAENPAVVAIAANGDVVVAGSFYGLDRIEAVPGVTAHMFVNMRSGATGAELWHAELQAPMDMAARTAAFDSTGNVIVAGEARHGVVASDSTFGEGDMFVAKYDAAGALLWRHGLRDGSGAAATTIAVGSDDTVYVGGDFRGAIDVGSGLLANTPPLWSNGFHNYDAFLAAFDPSGTLLWTRVFQGPGRQDIRDLTITPEGELSFVGSTVYGGASFGGPVFQPTLRHVSAFVTYTTAGDYVWSEPIAPLQFEEFGAVVVRRDQDRLVAFGHGDDGQTMVEGMLVADEHGAVESDSELTDQLLMNSAAVNYAGMLVVGEIPSYLSAVTADLVLSARDAEGQLLGQLDVTGSRPPPASAGSIALMDLAISGETVMTTGTLMYGADFGTGLILDHGSSLDANGMWHPGMGDTFVVAYDWVAD
jgi:hypothetical protein